MNKLIVISKQLWAINAYFLIDLFHTDGSFVLAPGLFFYLLTLPVFVILRRQKCHARALRCQVSCDSSCPFFLPHSSDGVFIPIIVTLPSEAG